MKKIALVFALAVLLPSLLLAWLAVRSLRDQQFLLERQQSLLCQRVTDTLAQNISSYLTKQQQVFGAQVEDLAAGKDAQAVAAQFDSELRSRWPLAEVGFCVTLTGKILSPSPNARTEARTFYTDNRDFLGNRVAVEVYQSANTGFNNLDNNGALNFARNTANKPASINGLSGSVASQRQAQPTLTASAPPVQSRQQEIALAKQTAAPSAAAQSSERKDGADIVSGQLGSVSQSPVQSLNYKAAQTRKVSPQSSFYQQQLGDRARTDTVAAEEPQNNLSKVVPAEAEFGQLIGSGTDGMLARFLQNKLRLMFWHRLSTEPDLIFGAQLNLDRVVDGLRGLVSAGPELSDEICLAVLDDNAKPVALSQAGFSANWKRPLVATEIGDALPHWEVAAYLINPARLAQTANTAKLTLGLLIAVLVLAIGVGSWLIVRSLNSELKLARQKTDFVGNVSHELKTPLTSIRMFSELLAEGRVADQTKQRSYLNIITAEAARLTRLINNVLDFSRMERGEKKYNFQPCDLVEVVRAAAQTFRPHLEAGGFKFDCVLPNTAVPVRGDADALSQIIVNLLSNAEKYSNGGKEITLELARRESPLPHAEVKVLDRGSGVPRGSEEKVFEKFYRAHDSLSSGVQGSGLGLTIARQIARAHGGDMVYEPREGGGSCFILRLPLKPIETTDEHE
ncbi:MAG: HAMP domain-containing sensor histidine kinase [Verrucomicrobiota bacterium]|jgi:signal transduction histidine kinase